MTNRESLFPVFLKLAGRRVLVVGGGPVAASKLAALAAAGAVVHVVAPDVVPEIAALGVAIARREFVAADLDDAWFVVAAATPEVNRQVADAAESRHVFVNAVDDLASASAYLGGVVRKGGVTLAISTDGRAPALAGLLREGLETRAARRPGEAGTRPRDAARRDWKADGRADGRRDGRCCCRRSTGCTRRVDTTPRRACVMSTRGHVVAGRRRARGPGVADASRALARLRQADLVLYDALVPRGRSSRWRGAPSGSPWASAAAGRRSGRRRFTAS